MNFHKLNTSLVISTRSRNNITNTLEAPFLSGELKKCCTAKVLNDTSVVWKNMGIQDAKSNGDSRGSDFECKEASVIR